LRERSEDIPLLVEHFLREFAPAGGGLLLEDSALEALMEYGYPGNVRELKSLMQSAVNLARGQAVSIDCLPEALRRRRFAAARRRVHPENAGFLLADIEKQHILDVYDRMGCNKVRTARALGLGLNTLRRKLKAYDAS
jgi:DNA-binding NtrC family response regulator